MNLNEAKYKILQQKISRSREPYLKFQWLFQ
ncbi:hypothetical protein Golax_019629 [Gossypium laxum]|uniref:Uncharacterized protein n=1 Tax=Gossypium laxum TaxID=34288 RepID=A0A7J8Z8M8_9ROSI|nr:hypothetical protein [Gossypium laxum]